MRDDAITWTEIHPTLNDRLVTLHPIRVSRQLLQEASAANNEDEEEADERADVSRPHWVPRLFVELNTSSSMYMGGSLVDHVIRFFLNSLHH